MSARFRLPPSNRQLVRDLDDEMALHLEMRTRALEQRGLSPAEARAEAERMFGDVPTLRSECLEIDRTHHASQARASALRDLVRDVRLAARSLLRDRAFALLSIGIFALGIGASTALFSVYNAVVLHPLDVPAPEQVVWVTTLDDEGSDGVSPATYFAWEERAARFEALATVRTAAVTLTGERLPARLNGLLVGRGFFETLDVAATVGRRLEARDYTSGAAPVVVIGTALWRRDFGGDRDIVGKSITLDGTARTVVGILPPSADVVSDASDFWIPDRLPDGLRTNITPFLDVVGRLAPNANVVGAEQELQSIVTSSDARPDRREHPLRVQVQPLGDYLTTPFRDRLALLLLAVLAVLAIGAVNVANLLLARGAGRAREMALRASLGASRGRLVRQLFTEHLLLSVIGGAVGILLGTWLIQMLVAILPPTLPRIARVHLDAPAVAVAALLTFAAALLAGLVPAWRTTALDLRGALQDGGRGTSSGAANERWRRAFVIGELAVTVVLLFAAGLLVRSAAALGAVAPGFSSDSVITARYALPVSGYPDAPAVQAGHARILASVREALGERAAISSKIPLDGNSGGGSGFYVVGSERGAGAEVNAALRLTVPGYFASVGMTLVRGRDFSDADGANAPRAVVISEGLARRLGIEANAIGQRIAGTSSPFRDSSGTPYPWEVVGVVRDPRDWGLRNDPQPQLFIPLPQTPEEIWEWSGREMNIVARSTQSATAMQGALASAVARVDPTLALYDVRSMRQRLRDSQALERANTILLSALGGAALLLAITGLYGVVSYGVQQRRTEFGVRLALGATPATLVALVARWSTRLAVAGLLMGLPLALLAARALRGLLFGIGAFDVVTLGATALLVALVAIAGALMPARRAARVAPDAVLRT